jgi:hypothetical protein
LNDWSEGICNGPYSDDAGRRRTCPPRD